MKIPQANEIIKIEHAGKLLSAIVKSVSLHARRRGIHALWLQVERPIAAGEMVGLVTEEGYFQPVMVLKIEDRESGRLIQLEAFDGALPYRPPDPQK